MFGIPEWAIGVGSIMVLVAVLQVVVARLMPPGYRRRSWKHETLADSEEVHARLAEVDDLKQRVAELEERVDFAERLLARQREGERLPPA